MRFLLRIFLGFLMLCVFASGSYAALQLSNPQGINFGLVPAGDTAGVVTSFQPGETASGGRLRIRDTNNSNQNATINITVENCNPSSSILITNFSGTYRNTSVSGTLPFTRTGLQNPRNTWRNLNYSATMNVAENAPIGSQNGCIRITVNYDGGSGPAPSVINQPVTVARPMVLSDVQTLDFGIITKPSGNATVTMPPTIGGTATFSGTTAVGGTPQPARYNLTVDANKTINVSAVASPTSGNVYLSNLTLRTTHNNTQYTLSTANRAVTTNPSATTTALVVGARLNVTSSAATGSHTPGYIIEFHYQ